MRGKLGYILHSLATQKANRSDFLSVLIVLVVWHGNSSVGDCDHHWTHMFYIIGEKRGEALWCYNDILC